MAPARPFLLAPPLALLCAACTAPTPGHGSGAALTSATPTDGDPAVVAIVGAPFGCTGTLVGERAVLTAAHCRAEVDPAAVEVLFGSERSAEATRIPVLHVVTHPDADDTADHDLALLLLTEPAPTDPIPLASGPAIAATPPVDVRLVGFGVSGADAGDDGIKREGTATTSEVTPWHVVLGADPSLPCLGDSGGPVLVSTGSGERLAAVVSRGDADCMEQGKATRVDAHLEGFLRPRLDAWAAGELPGETGDACATDADCLTGDCLAEQEMCSTRCVSGRGDCPGGFRCEHLGGVDFYCLPEPPDDSGCGAAAGRSTAPGALPLVGAILLWLRRRRATAAAWPRRAC